MATIIVDTELDTVDATDGVTSLREAITTAAGAAGPDRIEFASTVSTIELSSASGPLVIKAGENVTIDGDNDGDGSWDVVLNGKLATPLFTIETGATATLEALFLRGGSTFNGPLYQAVGANGTDGAAGAANTDGTAGGDAGAGATGVGAILNGGNLTLLRSVLLENNPSPGKGGKGGDGGDGGLGDAGVAGTAGSDGGNGGVGGKGGDGGDVGTIINSAGATLTVADSWLTQNGFIMTDGIASVYGNYGHGGNGGVGGMGGDGKDGGIGGTGANGGDGGDSGAGGTGGAGGSWAEGILNYGTVNFLTTIVGSLGNTGGNGGFGTGGLAGGAGLVAGLGGAAGGGVGLPGTNGTLGAAGSKGADGTDGGIIVNLDGGSGTATAAQTLFYLHADSLAFTEGTGGTTTVTVNVNRLGDPTEAVSVGVRVVGDKLGHVDGADFVGGVLPTTTLNFVSDPSNSMDLSSGGTNSQTFSFDIATDTLAEGNEAFSIELFDLVDPVGGKTAALGTSTLYGSITDDDQTADASFITYENSQFDIAALAELLLSTEYSTAITSTAGSVRLQGMWESKAVDIEIFGAFSYGSGNIPQGGNAYGVGITYDSEPQASISYKASVPEIASFVTATPEFISSAILGLSWAIGGTKHDDIAPQGHMIGGKYAFDLAGDDTISLGYGNDNYFSGSGNDKMYGEQGDDSLDGGSGDDSLYGGIGVDVLWGRSGIDRLFGGDGDDTLDGGENPETGPGAGGDVMYGGQGHDIYYVDSAYDYLDEGIGGTDQTGGADDVDTIYSTSYFFWDYFSVGEVLTLQEGASTTDVNGVDIAVATLVGGGFDNLLRGNSGNNNIYTNWGNDKVYAGAGTDHIDFTDRSAGATGVNQLIFEIGNGYDVVWNFAKGVDTIDVSAFASYGVTDASSLMAKGHDDGIGNSYFALGETESDYLYIIGHTKADLNEDASLGLNFVF